MIYMHNVQNITQQTDFIEIAEVPRGHIISKLPIHAAQL